MGYYSPHIKKSKRMNMYRKFETLLLGLFLCITACSDGENVFSYPKSYDTMKGLVFNGELLKSVTQEDDNYVFIFESQTIEMAKDAIKSVQTDDMTWKTTVTFANGSTYIVPSIGTSIDNLIVKTVLNPSGYNPLAANVFVELPALGRIKIIVHSKPNSNTPDVEFQPEGAEKSQVIPILGLYPSYKNQVTLVYSDKQGNERARSTLLIKTEPLDVKYLPSVRVIKANITEMEPGMNLISSPGREETDTSIPYMVDADGEIRWVLDWAKHPILNHIGAQCGLFRMKNGHYIAGDFNNGQLVELNVLGEIINKWDLKAMGYNFHHQAVEISNGKILILVSKIDAMLADKSNTRILDHVIEFDSSSGNITKEWDYAQMLDSARMNPIIVDGPSGAFYLGQSKSNWLHNNGIWEENGEFVATGRWLGFFKYTYNGNIKYIMAPHNGWKEKDRKYLLTPLDRNGQPITDLDVLNGKKDHEDFEWCWGPHCPVVMPNGNIMVFDNGYNRHYTAQGKEYSRVVEYKINEKNMTVSQVWQYGKERGSECYGMAVSGVQYLKTTGNRLFCPGIGNTLSDGSLGGRIIEINADTQEIVFEMELSGAANTIFHRASRISLYPDIY